MQPVYIMTCWLNHSWKTTFGWLLNKQLFPSIVLDNDLLRVFAQDTFPDLYTVTNEHKNREWKELNMKMFLVKNLLDYSLSNHVHCIHTACNIWAAQRKKFFDLAKVCNAKTYLIYFNLPFELLYSRALQVGTKKNQSLYSRWYIGNLERMKGIFEAPSSSEADVFIEMSNNDQHQEIIDLLVNNITI